MSRADGKLTLDSMFPRHERVRIGVRAMMASFKSAVRAGDLKDRPGEEAMAAGYGRTLGEALDLLDNVADVEVSDRLAAAIKGDVWFEHLVGRVQRQVLLLMLTRAGEVRFSRDELESAESCGRLVIDMPEDGVLSFRRRLDP